jgi:cysteinyl-tRNA synthetase
MFSGEHPLLTKGFSPMVIRFFILQTHYRSTLDFSSEALTAAEKGMKRLFEAFEVLKKLEIPGTEEAADKELDSKINSLVEEFINDDFNTAKVLANMFEIVPVINSMKDGLIKPDAISTATFKKLKESFSIFLEQILGLKDPSESSAQLNGLMDLLIEIRKEAKSKKDFFTSDKIRKQLAEVGIEMKDEKDGNISWSKL